MCAFSVSPFVGPACVRNLRSLGTVQRLGSIVAWFFSRFVRTLCVQLVGYVRMYVRIREEDRAVFNGEPLSRGWTNVTLWSGHNRASGIEVAIVPGGQLLHPRPRVHVQRFLQKSGTKRWSFSLTSSLHGSLNTHRYRNGIENGDALLRVHANKTKDIKVNINEDVARRWI